MISVRIPYAFIDERVDLSWSEVLFGLEQQLTDSEPAIAIATEQVSREEQVPYQKIQVAALSKGDPVIDLVSEIVEYEPCASAEEIKAKWLYLVLAWIYENREGVADPLGIVEEIYADFDYPGEVAPFVRYMPMSGPDLGRREKNEERMYGNWKAYLLEAGRHYAKLRKG